MLVYFLMHCVNLYAHVCIVILYIQHMLLYAVFMKVIGE